MSRTVVTAEKSQQLVADYIAGIKISEIGQKYGVSMPTVSYHIKKAGIARRIGSYSSNTEAPRPIAGATARRCLRCRKMFSPYTLGWSSFQNICFDCWRINRDFGRTKSNPM
jgi:hypothetical protein